MKRKYAIIFIITVAVFVAHLLTDIYKIGVKDGKQNKPTTTKQVKD